MKYTAKPVIVDAFQILSIGDSDANDSIMCACDDGQSRLATSEMCARMTPSSGDYWVIQPDGYEYLNPKTVFEAKYAPTPGVL
jgi:hypothetical protein